MQIDLASFIAFERAAIHYRLPPPPGHPGLETRPGDVPILFSAPHACRHRRAGRWKNEDEYTGAIAEGLHRLTGAHAIFTTFESNPDPHDDDDHNFFKQSLAAFVRQHPTRLIVDLHGVKGTRPFGIGLGSMKGLTAPGYEPAVISAFEQMGFSCQMGLHETDHLAINHPRYTGGLKRPTVTRFAYQVLGIPAVQIEINAWARVLQRLPSSSNARQQHAPGFKGEHTLFRRMIEAFSLLVAEVSAREYRQKRPSADRS
ncbi:MAG: hypothetical protein ACLFTK_09395 [Anaerolineales bacterium]